MAAKKTPAGEPNGYAGAMSELETILREIDSNTVDVDVLSDRVQRASYLVEWCTERITAAQMTIDDLVASLADDGYPADDEEDEEDDDDDDFGDGDDE